MLASCLRALEPAFDDSEGTSNLTVSVTPVNTKILSLVLALFLASIWNAHPEATKVTPGELPQGYERPPSGMNDLTIPAEQGSNALQLFQSPGSVEADAAMSALSGDTKLCSKCHGEIPVVATKCMHCGSSLGWRSLLDFAMAVLTLSAALVPLYFLLRGEIRKALPAEPHLIVKHVMSREGVVFVALVNEGDYDAVISDILVTWDAMSGEYRYEGADRSISREIEVVPARSAHVLRIPNSEFSYAEPPPDHIKNPGLSVEYSGRQEERKSISIRLGQAEAEKWKHMASGTAVKYP